MSDFEKHVQQISEQRLKFRKFECVEVPIGFSIIKNDGKLKGSILYADEEYIHTSIPTKYEKISYQNLLKDWLLEIQMGKLMIPGMPDDSGVIIPTNEEKNNLQFAL